MVNNNPRALWALLIFMLIVTWALIPLGSFYRYAKEQHCLLTIGRPTQTSIIAVKQAEATFTPRFGTRYQISLLATDFSFRYEYDGYNGAFDQTLYQMSDLVPLLQKYQAESRPFKLEWVRAPLFFGDAQIMSHINGERIPSYCNLWWFLWYVPLFLFFTAFTVLIVAAVKTAVALKDQNPDISEEDLQQHVIEAGVVWFLNLWEKRKNENSV